MSNQTRGFEDLTGKRVLVTGAASGIGSAIAQRIAASGGRVLAVDIAAPSTSFEHSDEILTVRADITDHDQIGSAVETCVRELGGLDGVVAAAGITHAGTIDTMELNDWNRVIDTNLTSVFLLAKLCVPLLRENGGGAFIAIASQVGLVGYPQNIAYCAAKAGLINFIRALAVDCSSEGIRSNAVCPGPINTPMLQEGFTQSGESLELATARVPAGRVGDPSEIAAVTSFLLSDECKFVTGAAWAVDGGYTAQ